MYNYFIYYIRCTYYTKKEKTERIHHSKDFNDS